MKLENNNKLNVYHCNVFCDAPFNGNQATVVVSNAVLSSRTMQLMAREFNTSETMFLTPMKNGVSLTFFTPSRAISSCAHGTLAAAHIAMELQLNGTRDYVSFDTENGYIECRKVSCNNGIFYEFVADKPKLEVLEDCFEPVLQGLGVTPHQINAAFITSFEDVGRRLLLSVDKSLLKDIRPHWEQLKQAQQSFDLTAVFAFSWEADHANQVQGRMFSPRMGINEDPVNGNSVIAFSSVLIYLCNKSQIEVPEYLCAHQGFSVDRLGVVRVTLGAHSHISNQVALSGQVITLYCFEMTAL